ncbi:MAG: hypothetical protein HQ558_00035 [Candidatus Omnitrophica bacterium]|nr:hypothetical protein [Candidatus Omnitrophota bacterium]
MKNIINILLIAVLLAAIGASAWLFMQKETEKSRRIQTEEKLWQEKVSKKKSAKDLSAAEKERDYLQKKIAQSKEAAAALEAELVRNKKQVKTISDKISQINSNTSQSKAKAEQTKKNIELLSNNISEVASGAVGIKEQFTMLQKTKAALKKHLASYRKDKKRESVAAEAGLEGIQQGIIPLRPILTGEILTINNEFNFIVVDLGSDDGTEEGMILDIVRDDGILGQAKVETVRTNISAAALSDKELITKIRSGDKVVTSQGALLAPETTE